MTGQSNNLGYGQIKGAGQNGTLEYITQKEKKYQHLVDDATGDWTVRSDVMYVYESTVTSSDQKSNMTVGLGSTRRSIGNELQIGHVLGYAFDDPVLIIKLGVGNRALGWDFLPPGSPQYETNGTRFAGYGQCPDQFSASATPGRANQCGCLIGSECSDIFWSSKQQCVDQNCWCEQKNSCPPFYAGHQFDTDLRDGMHVLDNIADYYPGYHGQGFEVAGFFWFQGYRDKGTEGYADHYFPNLVQYIKSMRDAYSSYGGNDAPFVVGTIGHKGCDQSKWNEKEIAVWQAQIDVSSKVAEFVGNVKTIDTRPSFREKSESPSDDEPHYFWNANMYLETGTKMGWAMVDFLLGTSYFEPASCL
jgi:hypothetical protein